MLGDVCKTSLACPGELTGWAATFLEDAEEAPDSGTRRKMVWAPSLAVSEMMAPLSLDVSVFQYARPAPIH